jgi:hypothetical protein
MRVLDERVEHTMERARENGRLCAMNWDAAGRPADIKPRNPYTGYAGACWSRGFAGYFEEE